MNLQHKSSPSAAVYHVGLTVTDCHLNITVDTAPLWHVALALHLHTHTHTSSSSSSSSSFLAWFPDRRATSVCVLCFSPVIAIPHILFIKPPFSDRGSFQNLGLTKLPFFLFIPFLLPSFPLPSLSSLSVPLPSLRSRPLNPAIWERFKLSQRVRASPVAECTLVQFICKTVSYRWGTVALCWYCAALNKLLTVGNVNCCVLSMPLTTRKYHNVTQIRYIHVV